MNLRPDGLVHLVQHLSQGQIHPAVSFARAINDPAFERRFGFGQRAVEQMDGIIKKIIIGFADGNMKLATQLRSERRPILRQRNSEIVFLPLLGNGVISISK